MKKVYFLLFALSVGLMAQAQDFVFSTEKHISKQYTDEFETSYIKFKTPTPETILCKWKLLENSLPNGWDYSLCDYGSCYITIPFEGTMSEMSKAEAESGTDIFFSLSLSTMKIEGEGMLRLYVYDSKDESRGDTVSFAISYKKPSSVAGISFTNSIEMYPNPAKDVVSFKAIDNNLIATVQLTNMSGVAVLNINRTPSKPIDVSTLVPGVYVVRIKTQDGTMLTDRLIIQ